MARNRFKFSLDMPNPSSIMKIVFQPLPGTIVRHVHLELLRTISKKAKVIMKRRIMRAMPLYRGSERRSDGSEYRWQTPTGALHNSIGIKMPTLTKLKSKTGAFAVVGPRTDFKVTKKVRERIDKMTTFGMSTTPGTPFHSAKPAPARIDVRKLKFKEKADNVLSPSRYAHLANFGHGPGPKGFSFHAKPRDYMTGTMQEVEGILQDTVRSQYTSLYTKVVSRDTARRIRRAARLKVSV